MNFTFPYARPAALVVFLFWMHAFTACNNTSSAEEQCCLTHHPESPERIYCNQHQVAATLFVRSNPSEPDSMRLRLIQFTSFYDTVENCTSLRCIEEHLPEEFILRYTQEHALADSNVSLNENDKVRLVLCGFNQARKALTKSLNTAL